MKTLACILEYNSPQLTDTLYELLDPYQSDGYDLMVLDNGSDQDKISKYASLRSEQNVYFGGGLNIMFDYMLNNPEYDSLLFLNNDLVTTGQNFVKTLRNEMKDGFEIISPCNIQPEKTQNHWKQMHCWCKQTVREVKWADQQGPLISRKFIEEVKEIDPLLIWGWGIDVLFGIIAEKKGWKTGVVDYAPVIHLGSIAIKSNQQNPEMREYFKNADKFQWEYFQKNGIVDKVLEFKRWAENYSV